MKLFETNMSHFKKYVYCLPEKKNSFESTCIRKNIYHHTFFHWGVEYVVGAVPFVGDRGVVLDPRGVVDDSADGSFPRGRYSLGIHSEFCGRIQENSCKKERNIISKMYRYMHSVYVVLRQVIIFKEDDSYRFTEYLVYTLNIYEVNA